MQYIAISTYIPLENIQSCIYNLQFGEGYNVLKYFPGDRGVSITDFTPYIMFLLRITSSREKVHLIIIHLISNDMLIYYNPLHIETCWKMKFHTLGLVLGFISFTTPLKYFRGTV